MIHVIQGVFRKRSIGEILVGAHCLVVYNLMAMKSIRIQLLLLLLLIAVLGGAVRAGQTYEELIVWPKDPAEAQRVRIWLGLERKSNCRVTVDILDEEGRPIRHVLDRLMKFGYYNLYWDKKDDSGRYVDPGVYTVLITDCGKAKYAEVEAAYRPWERWSSLEVVGERAAPVFRLTLAKDSAEARLVMTTVRDDTIAVAMADTVLSAGVYDIPFPADPAIVGGVYLVKLLINEGFVREERFAYTP